MREKNNFIAFSLGHMYCQGIEKFFNLFILRSDAASCSFASVFCSTCYQQNIISLLTCSLLHLNFTSIANSLFQTLFSLWSSLPSPCSVPMSFGSSWSLSAVAGQKQDDTLDWPPVTTLSQGHIETNSLSRLHPHIRSVLIPTLHHFFGRWEGKPGENPHINGENMQTPQSPRTRIKATIFLLWGDSANHNTTVSDIRND